MVQQGLAVPPARAQRVAAGLGVAVVATGVAVLVGWILGVAVLKTVLPGLPAMNPLVAVGLMLAGASLLLQVPKPTVAGRLLGLVVAGLGAARMGEYLLDLPLGVDRWLFARAVEEAAGNASIAPNSAFCFLLVGTALATIGGGSGRVHVAGGLAGTAFVTASLTVIAYAFGLREFGGALRAFPMALHTGISFMLLGTALLLARPTRGLAAVVGASDEGGAVARRLLPVAIGAPLLLGYVILALHQRGLYGTAFALTLFAAATALVLGAVVVAESVAVGRSDRRRRAAEAALARQLHQTDDAERATGRGSWSWDLDQDKATWSAGMYRVLGVDERTFRNTNEAFLALVHPDDRARMGEAMGAALREGGTFLQDYRIRRPDGAERHLRGEGRVVLGEDGKARQMFGVVQDVTEVRELEAAARRERERRLANEAELERLRRNEAFLAGFVNSTAHELATPLTPVLLQMHVLRNSPASARPESVELLARNVERLRQAIEGIVAAARSQGRGATLDVRPQPLRDMVAEAVAAHARPGGPHVTADGPAVQVMADAGALRQVVANLLGNAVRFTPPSGRVTVRWAVEGPLVRVQVADTGMGIAPERMQHLFRPYGKAHDEMRTESGIGLGLYLVARLVASMGGEVGAHSEGPGKGTTFWFTLPVASPAGTPAGQSRLPPPGAPPPPPVAGQR